MGRPPKGSHQQLGDGKLVIIFQTDDLLRLNTVVVIPLTSDLSRAGFANNALIPRGEAGQDFDSVALCHQIRAIDRPMLVHKIGDLRDERLSEIEAKVRFVLGLW
jgi:mRNA interferase MazF